MTPRFLSPLIIVLAAGVAAGMAACGATPTADSSLPNFTDTVTVWTVNGAPVGAPTAIDLFDGAILRADQAFVYDLAFDIDSVGQVVIYPVSKLATSLSAVRRVGLQIVQGPFASVGSAPRTGYAYDSTFHVPVGTSLAIESDDATDCGTSITGTAFYSKITILSIDTVARTLRPVFTVDRNCGFHSLNPNAVPNS